MQEASHAVRWRELIKTVVERIGAMEFCQRHRRRETDFTRQRLLSFSVVMLLLLQKSTKSIQRHLNTFFHQLWPGKNAATQGAWTQARAKLKHTAFIELNQEVLLPGFYADDQAPHRRDWRGHRLLGIDSSMVRLPSHEEIFQVFGKVEVTNQRGGTGTVYAAGRLSVVYDLLNEIGVDAQLVAESTSEVTLAMKQLSHVGKNDVLIWDRGFTGFVLMAQTLARGANFIGRCSTASFAAAQELFRKNQAGVSRVVSLKACWNQQPELRRLNLPMEMIVRFVTVRLPTGELEVLVTSLLDSVRYPTEEFSEVYHWRWQHETYYLMLKSRLDLENWSGQTLEAVSQDVQAAVFVSNLESLLSQEPQEALRAGDQDRKYPAQINRAVSYHALKERMLDLLWSRQPLDQVLCEMQTWMLKNPVAVRKREIPRRKLSLHRSYHHQRHIKKSTF
jgi:hypothetical protein